MLKRCGIRSSLFLLLCVLDRTTSFLILCRFVVVIRDCTSRLVGFVFNCDYLHLHNTHVVVLDCFLEFDASCVTDYGGVVWKARARGQVYKICLGFLLATLGMRYISTRKSSDHRPQGRTRATHYRRTPNT